MTLLALRAAQAKVLRELAALPPYERVVVAHDYQQDGNTWLGALAKVRVDAVAEMRRAGLTVRQISDLVGLSPDRVEQLAWASQAQVAQSAAAAAGS